MGCSDKTGTLTTNQMSVTKVACVRSELGGLAEFEVSGECLLECWKYIYV